jgi:hypothetical protein
MQYFLSTFCCYFINTIDFLISIENNYRQELGKKESRVLGFLQLQDA